MEGFAKQFEITTINLNARSLRSLKTQRGLARRKNLDLKKILTTRTPSPKVPSVQPLNEQANQCISRCLRISPLTPNSLTAIKTVTEEISYKVIKLIEQNPEISQRELSRQLGVSLGKINYCVRALNR